MATNDFGAEDNNESIEKVNNDESNENTTLVTRVKTTNGKLYFGKYLVLGQQYLLLRRMPQAESLFRFGVGFKKNKLHELAPNGFESRFTNLVAVHGDNKAVWYRFLVQVLFPMNETMNCAAELVCRSLDQQRLGQTLVELKKAIQAWVAKKRRLADCDCANEHCMGFCPICTPDRYLD